MTLKYGLSTNNFTHRTYILNKNEKTLLLLFYFNRLWNDNATKHAVWTHIMALYKSAIQDLHSIFPSTVTTLALHFLLYSFHYSNNEKTKLV